MAENETKRGRPVKEKSNRVVVYLHDSTYEALNKHVEQNAQTKSGYIELLIKKALEENADN